MLISGDWDPRAADGTLQVLKQQLGDAQFKHKLRRQALYCHTLIIQRGLIVVTFRDAAYPDSLKSIPDPPLALFLEASSKSGLAAETDKPIDVHAVKNQSAGRIAVVGSRRALLSSREFTEELCLKLADFGFEIISGLALGIDAAAHRGALKSGAGTNSCKTSAVLGSGHQNIYPKSNGYLYRQILQSGGAVISEFLPIVAPLKHNFPARNRIVSGLCVCVIVIEATAKSGSLITARLALEQGRDVLVAPGMVRDPRFTGCHRLIKQGAALIEGYEDVLACLGVSDQKRAGPTKTGLCGLSASERRLLEQVEFRVTGLDQLVTRTASTIPVLMETLLSLELQGYVRACSGGYVRVM